MKKLKLLILMKNKPGAVKCGVLCYAGVEWEVERWLAFRREVCDYETKYK